MLGTVLLVILILLLLGALPTWPYSAGWGILSIRWFGNSFNYSHHSFIDGYYLVPSIFVGLLRACSKSPN